MIHTLPTRVPAPGAAYVHLLEQVRYNGAYPTRERAERAVRTVLEALARQLTDAERAELAGRLPAEAAAHLQAHAPTTAPLTAWNFVKELADRTGASPATTRWDVGTVLTAVARLAGDPLIGDIVRRLPTGYALLFGRIELPRPQAA